MIVRDNLHILMITSEYPSKINPEAAPFIAREVELLRSAGVKIDVFPFRGRRRLFNYFIAWIQAHKKMKERNFDLVHAHFGQSGLLALFPKVYPLVVTFRGSDVEGILNSKSRYTLQGKILQVVSRYIAKRADECILVSSSMLHKLPKREYHIIPSGIDLELFKPGSKSEARKSLGLSLEKQYILFGGNPVQPVKRYNLALDVVGRVQEQMPEVELITPRNVLHSMMPVYMNACDVLLMTSSHEGSPNMVKEALACDLPIVSTDVGDVRERIGHVDGCFVSKTGNTEQMANCVIEVLQNYKRINGRTHILDLNEYLRLNKIIGVYNQALRKSVK